MQNKERKTMNQKALQILEYDKIIRQLEDYATSALGKALCRSLLPSSDLEKVRQDQQETADALDRIRMKGSLSFSGCKDVSASLKRLEIGSALSIQEILAISAILTVSARAKNYGRHEESELPDDSLEEFFRSLEPLTPVNNEIKRCIISEEEVSDDASPGLHKVRRAMKNAADRLHTQLNSLLNSHRSYLQDAVITMRDGRYCLPIKSEYKNQVPGMVHDQSSTGSTLFIEPMAIIKLNNEMRELEIAEQKEIEAVLAALSNQISPYLEEIRVNQELLARLDFIFAKAGLARHQKASQPKFNDQGFILIKDGRHPLLDPQKVVPITITLGKAFDLLIVTGPNTGGKTVSLKTVGLFTLMGQAGLHIPAFDGSELSVFTEVFADIGDEQSIEQSLSTFSSHMTNIVSICGKVNGSSLVLIDELGAGTDPVEGAALAEAILEYLHQRGAKIAATTHYAELKAYALETKGVENASCEFDVASLRPTYRLLIGMPGRSNAFAISKRLGMADEIIDRAKSLVSSDNVAFEKTVASLEESRQRYEKKTQEAEELMQKAKAETERARQYKDGIEKLRQDELDKARTQATRIVDQAKRSAYMLTMELEKLKKESASNGSDKAVLARRAKQLMKKSSNEFAEITNPLIEAEDEDYVLPRPLKVGDNVVLADMGENAVVTATANKKGLVEVVAGNIKMRTPEKNLRLASAVKKSKQTAAKTEHIFRPADGGKSECDLRGMNVEEAIAEIDRHIDMCMRNGLGTIHLIHGKGTGVLRKGVQEYLRKNKFIKSFRLGTYGEGESGVTIAQIK